jgi:ankyrin repeat protein
MWAAGHDDETAAEAGVATVTLLLDKGAAIEAVDQRGRTALMIAAERDHPLAVELLLARGADATRRDAAGQTAADLTTDTAIRNRLGRS